MLGRAIMAVAVISAITSTASAQDVKWPEIDFGRYHALVIGNKDYRYLGKLETAVADAEAVAALLEDRYGFQVTKLLNATWRDITEAFNRLRQTLTENDNLLVYYAGHSVLRSEADQCYWLPVDARPDSDSDWFSNTRLTRYLRALSARHVMVIADSCYAGNLTRAATSTVRSGAERAAWIERMNAKRSRTALASGGLESVQDSGGGGHSVFALAFLDTLRENSGILFGQELFDRVKGQVVANADQMPLYSDIRLAGHEIGGDFLFVPRDINVSVSVGTSAAPRPEREVVFWQSIQDSDDPAMFEAYLTQFPEGTFAPLARLKIEALRPRPVKKPEGTAPPEALEPRRPAEEPQVALAVPAEPRVELDPIDADYIAVRNANVRKAPTIESARVTTLARGTSVRVAGKVKGGNWYRVEHEGKALGYVFEDLLKPLEASGVAFAPPPPPAPTLDQPALHVPQSLAPVAIYRYPTIEAPDEVQSGQLFSVQVSLTNEPVSSAVTVVTGPQTSVAESGEVALHLPAAADKEGWTLDVVLSAPGFVFVDGRNTTTLFLPRSGDSTPALFVLRAEPQRGTRRETRLYATLWHKGNYLLRVIRSISVVALEARPTVRPAPLEGNAKMEDVPQSTAAFTSQAVAQAPQNELPAEPVRKRLVLYAEPADLTLFVLDRSAVGEESEIIINSPYLQPSRHIFAPPPGFAEWIAAQYERIVELAQLTSDAPLKERMVPQLRGLGRELYRNVAPPAFKQAFWRLIDRLGSAFHSIQIYTNNPVVPWELMRPMRSEDGLEHDFLGIDFRIARWHVAEGELQLDRPPQVLRIAEVVGIAPRYEGQSFLVHQRIEMNRLQSVRGFREVPGDFRAMKRLFGSLPQGIVHFSGHGVAGMGMTGLPEYSIRLEDMELDVGTLRGLVSPRSRYHPFIFLNACELGRADRVANFVDGWAPAMLNAGASGFMGGLWPLFDRAAAAFSDQFYLELGRRMDDGPVPVAELIAEGRRAFLRTGDPTYLAYVFYGDVNLRFIRN